MVNKINQQQGFSMVEIVVAAAIFIVAVAAFMTSFNTLRTLAGHTEHNTFAAVLLEEGGEALLILRDEGYVANIADRALNTAYYLHWNGNGYQLATTSVDVGAGYTRKITFNSVYRTGSGVLTQSGTLDANTRRALLEVIDISSGETIVSSETLIHNSYE